MKRALIWAVVCLLAGLFSHSLVAQSAGEAAEPAATRPQASFLRIIRFSGSVPGVQGQAVAVPVGITFALYTDQEGGSPLWLETQNVSLDQQGHYTVLLGATQSEGLPLAIFTSGEARWLGIQVQGRPEQPRVLLVSVPYALRAEEAQRLAGREASEFLLTEQLESKVQEQVETQVQQELESQGLVSEDGTIKAITDSASTFADSNNSQVVLVTQQGSGVALRAQAVSDSALVGFSSATSGTVNAIVGRNSSPQGRAVYGQALSTTGVNFGIMGQTPSNQGRGAFGLATSTVGLTRGLLGEVRSPDGIAGVFNSKDVNGQIIVGHSGPSNTEVFSVDGSGNVTGAVGDFSGVTTGVQGTATSDLGGAAGVLGIASAPDTQGVWGKNSSPTGFGVVGEVSAEGFSFLGPIGVEGRALGSSGFTTGVQGIVFSTSGLAVNGRQLAGSGPTIGVRGEIHSPDGTAGVFETENVNGKILSGLSGVGPTEVFSVDGSGNVTATSFSGDGSGLTGLSGWSLTGNAGTTPGTNFLGTTDNVALELHVNGTRALRLEPDAIGPNLISGLSSNSVTGGIRGATIAGGGRAASLCGPTLTDPCLNQVTNDFGTVSGGEGNLAGGIDSTVGGGNSNTASATKATASGGERNTAGGSHGTVGGGFANTAGGDAAAVAGGRQNTASANDATVGGGNSNTASGNNSTVPGGVDNTAQGDFSFAAGRQAKANHNGAFVWADSTAVNMASSATNQFIARASGGFFFQSDSTLDDQGGFINTSTDAFLSIGGTWTDSSDAALKENFAPAVPEAILARLAAMPVQHWNYKAESPDVHRLGPTAQDFYAAFGLGTDNKHISGVDAHGVAFAAIQALYRELQEEERQLQVQGEQIQQQQALLEKLQAELATLKATVAQSDDNQLAALKSQE